MKLELFQCSYKSISRKSQVLGKNFYASSMFQRKNWYSSDNIGFLLFLHSDLFFKLRKIYVCSEFEDHREMQCTQADFVCVINLIPIFLQKLLVIFNVGLDLLYAVNYC